MNLATSFAMGLDPPLIPSVLGALRYLISKLDARFMAKVKGRGDGTAPHDPGPTATRRRPRWGRPNPGPTTGSRSTTRSSGRRSEG
jgi:hypothetical protein